MALVVSGGKMRFGIFLAYARDGLHNKIQRHLRGWHSSMHHEIPAPFWRMLAEILPGAKIHFSVFWGEMTQSTYPGEQVWVTKVRGENGEVDVMVTASTNGLIVSDDGYLAMSIALEEVEKKLEEYPNDTDLQQELDDLKKIRDLLEFAGDLARSPIRTQEDEDAWNSRIPYSRGFVKRGFIKQTPSAVE